MLLNALVMTKNGVVCWHGLLTIIRQTATKIKLPAY
jgi:hypothetical protein